MTAMSCSVIEAERVRQSFKYPSPPTSKIETDLFSGNSEPELSIVSTLVLYCEGL